MRKYKKYKSICKDSDVVSDKKHYLVKGDTYFIYEEIISTGDVSTMTVCYYTKFDLDADSLDAYLDGPTGPSLPWLLRGIGFERHFYDEWQMRELKIDKILS